MSFKVGDIIKIKETEDFLKFGIVGKTGKILSLNQICMEVEIFGLMDVKLEKNDPTDKFENCIELLESKKSVPHGWLQWEGQTK